MYFLDSVGARPRRRHRDGRHRHRRQQLEELAAIPTVVGVATGIEKAEGVLGAVRGGIIDGLIIDAGLAIALLSRSL